MTPTYEELLQDTEEQQVNPDFSPCRVWQRSVDKEGYARIPTQPSSFRYRRVGRIVMELTLGRPLLRTEIVYPKCHCRTCINRDHLTIGTLKDRLKYRTPA